MRLEKTSLPKILHCANTFVEWEIESSPDISLYQAFHHHLVYLQLQFLPLLYADPSDAILVSDLPLESYPHHSLYTLEDEMPVFSHLESWGASQLVQTWAQRHGIAYDIPRWNLVREVNSKVFSFVNSPSLPGAALLRDEQEARHWLHHTPGKKVIKTSFGVSGRGHVFIEDFPFLHRQWKQGNPVIGEPWVNRIMDFSTQWIIDEDIRYCGSTRCYNDDKGQYRGNQVGPEHSVFGDHLPFLDQHIIEARRCLQHMKHLGYQGHVGIDAMIYTLPQREEPQLHPIVEINARKTMGWVALQLQQRRYPDQLMSLSYEPAQEGLLPSSLVVKNGKKISFARNINVRIYN